MAPHGDDDIYRPQDAVGEGLKGALTGGTFGLFAAAIQNAMAKQSIGALGVFTRSGILITTLAAAIGANQFVTVAASNLREKDDAWSAAAGGAAAGAIAGARVGRMPVIFGLGAGLAVVSATLKFTGGSLAGSRDPNLDHYAQKVAMRENRRRPIEETLAEVGEGRSIRPPGYEERRRQRLKEKYGVEIQTFSADPNGP